MITLKYFKKDNSVYLSHIDLQRHLIRSFKRAQFDVKYSSGFNPHMLVKLGVPLPLGINSSAEYVTVDCNVDPDVFLHCYNEACVPGLEGVKAFLTEKNPNLAAKVLYADYSIRAFPADKSEEINSLINKKEAILEYPTRKEPDGKRDIAPDLLAIKAYPDSINVCISALKLRADVLCESFAREFEIETDVTEIWRYEQYVRDGYLKTVDEYLTSIATKISR